MCPHQFGLATSPVFSSCWWHIAAPVQRSMYGRVSDQVTDTHTDSLWEPCQAVGNSGVYVGQIREHKSGQIKAEKLERAWRRRMEVAQATTSEFNKIKCHFPYHLDLNSFLHFLYTLKDALALPRQKPCYTHACIWSWHLPWCLVLSLFQIHLRWN